MSRGKESLFGAIAQVNDVISTHVRLRLDLIGISSATFDLLSAIHAADGRETQAQIGQRLGLSRATISEAITVAEKSGYVERVASSTDRRANTVRLSAAGHRIIQDVMTGLSELEDAVVAKLRTKEASTTVDSLRKLSSEIERFAGVGKN